ncbi:MAG: hypothetical protein M1355_00710 [Patescibacteria group bacterium]|nr:hypothetical protein [Patescibacteria group bacterium]MCL5093647.1 hypothetical protein [Patescibacteria group bacterium]
MKCPNCGEEAVNINGRQICLDCGIEVAVSDPSANTTVETEPADEVTVQTPAGENLPVMPNQVETNANEPKTAEMLSDNQTEPQETIPGVSKETTSPSAEESEKPLTNIAPEEEASSEPTIADIASDSETEETVPNETTEPLPENQDKFDPSQIFEAPDSESPSVDESSAGSENPIFNQSVSEETPTETSVQNPEPLESFNATQPETQAPASGPFVDNIVPTDGLNQILDNPVETSHVGADIGISSDIEVLPARRISRGSIFKLIIFTIILFLVLLTFLIIYFKFDSIKKLVYPRVQMENTNEEPVKIIE